MFPNQQYPRAGGGSNPPSYPQQSPYNPSGAYPQQQPPFGNTPSYGIAAGFGGYANNALFC